MAETTTGAELLAIAADAWGYAEAEQLDGWQLRAAGGFTSRANCAWPLGPLNRPLPDATAAVRAWYAARGLSAHVQVVAGSELDLALAALGHTGVKRASLRKAAKVEEVLALLLNVAPPGVKEAFSNEPTDDWLTVYRTTETAQLAPVVRQVLGSGSTVQYATVYDSDTGEPVAVGRAALCPDRWVGLAAIEVVPAARRRGLAKLVIDALLDWAADQGASDAFLEVAPENVPAVRLYESLGFTTRHTYHYRAVS